MHVVDGYLDSMNDPDHGGIVRETGVANDRIHIKNGYSSEVVAQVADDIGADLVIMGTLGQTGMASTRRGNTAERMIAALDDDVMRSEERRVGEEGRYRWGGVPRGERGSGADETVDESAN